MAYGNEGVPSNDDISNPSVVPSSSGAMIQHPYLNSNTNAAYASAAVAVAAVSSASPSSAVGPYQHYYGHPLPPQQVLHVQQSTGFYPTVSALNHHHPHGDFSNSSPSVASTSSSVESSRKPTNRKRNVTGSEKGPSATASAKPNAKRKPVDF
jgi:hypothetical protein